MKKALILLLLALALCFSASAESAEILGQPFPDFTTADTQGNIFTLSEALKNYEAVLINIWATWCPPCRAEMPFFNEVYEQYGDRVAFIALSCEETDTMEKIEAFRQENGLSFPMGRDEGSSLFGYLSGAAIPQTVIVDRFGNAAFLRVGSFLSAGEIKRTVSFFLGSGYTETVPLTDVPKDTSTRVFPASAATALHPENENFRLIHMIVQGVPEPYPLYVVEDDTALLRIDVAPSDDPGSAFCYDYRLNAFYELPDLLDAERGAFVCQVPMPGAEDSLHYTYVALIGASDEILADTYLIADSTYVEEFMEEIRSMGYNVTWEYADPAPAESAAPESYILHVADQNGAPVPGVMLNFCTDTACVMLQTDETGTVVFNGEPDIYHIQLLQVPEGYSFDANFEMHTGLAYDEWGIFIQKNNH